MKILRLLIVFVSLFFLSNLAQAQFEPNANDGKISSLPELDKKVSVDFVNAELKDVLKVFTKQTGINFVMEGTILDIKISLFLENVAIKDALGSIADAYKLSFDKIPGTNVFSVSPQQGMGKDLRITRVYKLKYLSVKKIKLMKKDSDGADSSDKDSGSKAFSGGYGASTSSTSSGSSGGTKKGEGNTGIINALLNVMSDKGILSFDDRSNIVIVTDYLEKFNSIEQVIAALDRKLDQVMIKADIIELTDSLNNIFGVQYNNSDGTLYGAGVTGTSVTTGFPWDRISGWITSQDKRDGRAVTLGTLSSNDFSLVINALNTSGVAKYLSKPRLLTVDGEPAIVEISADTAVDKTIQQDTQTKVNQVTFNRKDTGIMLRVTPSITGDKEFVSMLVEPSVARPIHSVFFPADDVLDVNKRLVRTNVRVRDGDTLSIGGLLENTKTKTINKMPFIGDIPLIGMLVTNKEETGSYSDLLIFITPTIIDDSNASSVAKKKEDDWTLDEKEDFLGKKDKKKDKKTKIKHNKGEVNLNQKEDENSEESDLKKKIWEYQSIVKKTPNDPVSHSNLGVAYSKAGKYDEAISEFKKAILIDPSSATAYNNLGNLYRIKKEYSAAIACLKKAIELAPDHPYAYTTMGLCYEMKNMSDEAKNSYLAAVKYAPNAEWTATARERLAVLGVAA